MPLEMIINIVSLATTRKILTSCYRTCFIDCSLSSFKKLTCCRYRNVLKRVHLLLFSSNIKHTHDNRQIYRSIFETGPVGTVLYTPDLIEFVDVSIRSVPPRPSSPPSATETAFAMSAALVPTTATSFMYAATTALDNLTKDSAAG